MICHYKKIVTVTVNPSLGDKHLEAYNAGLDEIFEEVESEGAVLDIQPIKNQDGATLVRNYRGYDNGGDDAEGR